MFGTVLVANRGEIAVRVIRALRSLGVRSVAVHSDADAGARHVAEADVAVRIGPAPARESYLSIPAVLEAARRTGAEAIHPGYGFLSENAAFARACAETGLVFIGPTPAAMEVMGDKISAKRAVAAAGVSVVPGRTRAGMTDADLAEAAAEVGYPVLVKPSAGGGGKGMHLVEAPDRLAAALVSARREAASAFGDDTLFVERFVARPRHIEVQVLADAHGHTISLGERECSLQRRHQKIVEEAPSVLLSPATRFRIGAAAVEIARAVDYLGAGTVEFIVSADRPEEFFFLEMNTRLQVEHPVTELVTGLDLVVEQLRIAAGEPLRLTQDDVRLTGHAIEARVYAEDPVRGFLPTGGTVLALREPVGDGIRVDSGLRVGTEVGSWYDPMLSKVIAWGPNRDIALTRLRGALDRTAVLGVGTNLGFLRALAADPAVRVGRIDTQFIDRELPALLSLDGNGGGGSGARVRPVPDEVLAGYALFRWSELDPGRSVVPPDLWGCPSGWRLGEHRPLTLRVIDDRSQDGDPARPAEVRLWTTPGPESPSGFLVSVDGRPAMPADLRRTVDELRLTLDGVTTGWLHAVDGDTLRLQPLAGGPEGWVVRDAAPIARNRSAADAVRQVCSPMPGAVLAVTVEVGAEVNAGQPLLVVEAMKMEHAVTAPTAGRLTELLVHPGDQVTMAQLLAVISPVEATDLTL